MPDFYYLNIFGLPIYLVKQDNVSKIRKRSIKSVAICYNGLYRLNIKREVRNLKYARNNASTRRGLYVGCIHHGDASIQHILILKWFNNTNLTTIHDSNGCAGYLFPILKYIYKESLVE